MRILITTPNLEKQGGVANFYAVLMKHLPEGTEFSTVGSRSDEESVPEAIKRFFADNLSFRRKLRQRDWDVIHLNPSLGTKAVMRDGLLLHSAKKGHRKVVVFFRGWNKGFEEKLSSWKLKLFKKIYFRADAIVVLANEFRERLRSWGYTGPIYIETTAVDDDLFDGFDIEYKLAENKELINLLFLARVEKAKGIYEALDAYRLLKSKHGNVKLTVAGAGSELPAVKRYVEENNLDEVWLSGYVREAEKMHVFRRADIYLFPTHGEGMPGSVLEAMAFGLPVITRPVGGIKDFFENGKMGFITESKDAKVFADLVDKLITDSNLRNKISVYNYEYAKQHFVASKVAKRIESIYRKVLSNQ